MKERSINNVLCISEVENAIDSLAKALLFSSLDNSFKWKWIALALHDALYLISLSCLADGIDSVLQSKRGDEDHWFSRSGRDNEWFKSNMERVELDGQAKSGAPYRIRWEKAPLTGRKKEKPLKKPIEERKVIGFWSSIARVQDGFFWMNRWCITKPLKLSDSDLNHLWYLHDFVRNNLVHSRPGMHEFDIERIRQACLVALEAIDFLLNESLSVVMTRIPEDQKITSKGYMLALRAVLENV